MTLACETCGEPFQNRGPGRYPRRWCRDCRGKARYAAHRDYYAAWREANRARKREGERARLVDPAARAAKRAADRARRQTPEYRAKNRARLHERRALKRTITVEKVIPEVVFERDGWRCQLCKRAIRRDLSYPDPGAASLDHIIPLSVGGTHEYRNVQAAHLRCNWSKGARPANEQLRAIA